MHAREIWKVYFILNAHEERKANESFKENSKNCNYRQQWANLSATVAENIGAKNLGAKSTAPMFLVLAG